MTAQELINAWGRKKYSLAEDAVITLEVEDRDSGYCPTCPSSYAALVIYADGKEVDEMRDVSISDLLNEILTKEPQCNLT